ncbi:efflux RND transporter periplasmic adaptor subunit [Luteimonas aquatica]|uniref:efflux RND transporter periplasmic adaptor subunit n=1 Tax=Luteimonas aquatica TaxID=450364 RepID=UPI001F58667E|nr:efflux RND transporter periplasmic adaptor subunit [Luteimonas aquatica]
MAMHLRTLALSSALLLVLAACGKGQEAGPEGAGGMPPPQVGVIQAKAGNVPLLQDVVGRLAAYRSADVRARVPGVLQKRVYEEGRDVREGQELFIIDPAQLRAALGQSQGDLARAQADYANAKAAADRARRLLPQKYVSQSDYDNALAAERTAAAQVQTARAAVDNAQINLGYASVRAPIAGRAGKQQVTEGALVGAGGTPTLLTTVDQIDPLYVNFSMSVTELSQVRRLQGDAPGGKAEVDVVLPDGSVYPRKGTLDFSGDVVDPTTGAVALRATLPNPDRVLLPGTYVTLKASLGSIDNAFLIPQAAVQRDAQSAYVLVVGKDGIATRKNIDAERSQGANWIVTKGVAEGDQVIVSGLQAVGMAEQMGGGKPVKVQATPWQPEGAPGGKQQQAPGPGKPEAAPQKGDDAAKQG